MNLNRYIFQIPPRNAAGGDGGSGTTPPAAGGGAGAPPPSPTPPAGGAQDGGQGGGQQTGAPPAAWSMPDGFPERLKADNADGFYKNLAEDWKNQHQKLSSLPPTPKDISEYRFEPSEKAKPYVGDLAKDPVYTAAQKAALAAGIPAEQFAKFIGGVYDGMVDGKLLAAPRDMQAERLDFLGKAAAGMSEDQAIAAIKPEIERLSLFVDGFVQKNGLPDGAKAELGYMLSTANGLRTLDALSKALAGAGLQLGGQPGGESGLTRQQLRQMQSDPRADRNSAQYDPAFARDVEAKYKSFFQ
jgi:hypothetical protein